MSLDPETRVPPQTRPHHQLNREEPSRGHRQRQLYDAYHHRREDQDRMYRWKYAVDNEKVRFYFNLVNDDPKMVAIMAALIFCLAVFELWTCEMPR